MKIKPNSYWRLENNWHIYYMMTDDKNIYDVKYYIKSTKYESKHVTKTFFATIKDYKTDNTHIYGRVTEMSETEFLAEIL